MIQRHTPLRRSSKLLKRSSLRKVSKKHAKELRTYSKLRKAFLEEHTTCQYPGCSSRAEDLHHKAKRGKFLNDTTQFMAVCRYHHDFIHQNPAISRYNGYLK
jgi:hypothetical protein